MTPYIIGIAGGSGSGKSTVTQQIMNLVGTTDTAVIAQDHYYLEQSHLSTEQRRRANYDHPHAYDWDLLIAQVNELSQGRPIRMPQYDFTEDNRAAQVVPVEYAKVIVIEGMYALYDERLREKMQLKIYVDTDADIRFIRRLQRDIRERGRSADSVIEQYLNTVRPMHLQFIEPSKRFADLILPHGANQAAIDMLAVKIQSL